MRAGLVIGAFMGLMVGAMTLPSFFYGIPLWGITALIGVVIGTMGGLMVAVLPTPTPKTSEELTWVDRWFMGEKWAPSYSELHHGKDKDGNPYPSWT